MKRIVLNIPAVLFLQASGFVSTDETRYYLDGVYVEPVAKGCRLVATDGHRLGAFHAPGGFAGDARIWPGAPISWAS